jgi:hypothetical protein
MSYKEIYAMKEPISHILNKAAGLPKAKQAEFLQTHPKAQLLASFLQLAVNKNITWLLPEGAPPYKPAEHDEWGILYNESRRMYLFLEGGHPTLSQTKRERIFIEVLESVHADDAKLLLLLKDQKLPEGLDEKQVIKAFPGIDGK